MALQETMHQAAALEPRPHRFTVADYYRMADVGIIGADARVELIEGEILDMSPIGPPHAVCVRRLRGLFEGLEGRAVVAVQDPIRLSRYAEPEPDVVLLRPRADYYRSEHPGPADALLVIEVGDSSVEYDRRTKVPLYARSGIPELWLVDLTRDHVVVYRDPTAGVYTTTRIAERGETIRPAALPDLEIAVDDVLG